MALFSGFNQLSSVINSTASRAQNLVGTANSLVSSASQGFDLLKNTPKLLQNPSLTSTIGVLKTANSVVDDFKSFGSNFTGGFGSRSRMSKNAIQGILPGAEKGTSGYTEARILNNTTSQGGIDPNVNDWRVSLSVPSIFADSPLLQPFKNTNGKLIFPFNPVILFGNSANYSTISPIHNNYPYYAYQNSQVDNITVTGEFYNESDSDAKYWIAVLHYLRTMTKMFYGNGTGRGNPPLIARLNGYGKHVLNNIPVLITNFTVDLPTDVDYISTEIQGETDYVPSQTQVTITLLPQYSRKSQSEFNLKEFADGKSIQTTQGFI